MRLTALGSLVGREAPAPDDLVDPVGVNLVLAASTAGGDRILGAVPGIEGVIAVPAEQGGLDATLALAD